LAHLYLKARGTSMSETLNDYIRRVTAFSTFVACSRYTHHVATPHPLVPLRPTTDPPK